MEFNIRPACQTDLKAVYALARNPHLAAPNHQAAERWWIKAFLDERQIFFVACEGTKVIGFTLGECAAGKVAIRHLTTVHPSLRGQGIGTKLMKAFEKESRRRGMTCVLCYVSGGKHWEQALKKNGYAAGSIVREYQKFL